MDDFDFGKKKKKVLSKTVNMVVESSSVNEVVMTSFQSASVTSVSVDGDITSQFSKMTITSLTQESHSVPSSVPETNVFISHMSIEHSLTSTPLLALAPATPAQVPLVSEDHKYEDLLTRLYNKMGDKVTKKQTLQPPKIGMEGRKTVWTNFLTTCIALNRESSQVLKFFQEEFQTICTVSGIGELMIKGRYKPVEILTILKKYIKEFVKCPTCNSTSTSIEKDSRLNFLQCEVCGSKTVVKLPGELRQRKKHFEDSA